MSTVQERWLSRLNDLPSLALPTDFPRNPGDAAIEAVVDRTIGPVTTSALARLSVYTEGELDYDEEDEPDVQPTMFTILLAAFAVILMRHTGESDMVIAASSAETRSPLILRLWVDPGDAFWSLVRQVEAKVKEAQQDSISYSEVLALLKRRPGDVAEGSLPPPPIFRVRFLDETDTTEPNFVQSTSSTTEITITLKKAVHDMLSSHQSLLPSLALRLNYNAMLFTQERINSVIDQIFHVVQLAAQNPTETCGGIPLATPKHLKVIPDPRAPLGWCDYKGAITDIFARNAEAHPDRVCIVETRDNVPEDVPPRTFSYKQIHEASNILARHLVSQGVAREDVVTVYSTRSVDLVVAVMGVLKAGATFSVIDPAYPPTRQNIYLQVAQPRALVILRRAGSLLPPVQEYINKELDLKTVVPALALEDDGSVYGGQSGGGGASDMFDVYRASAAENLNIPLGPDSVATLSFTSGSTGIPKGVRGRHFSLTHFFPWMAQRFQLSENDRFTMLSGIAHDPIQRDIFTPLFLGAQLRVPTAEIIGTPGALADWVADNECTVTHLTPAMGQLLSAQATRSIPSLRNAFFVGDILTKRDCARLQQLAPNVRIINMFGTTETQRAVSYYALPAASQDPSFLAKRKDVLPAGQGMKNVQMLVVSRYNKYQLCAVGEIGEIYVRSGGLAEGYLRLPDATAEKFVGNWFADGVSFPDTIDRNEPWSPYWKGVRDRMYRSGDLGRYTPEGIVECTGRADDQVKIRGFRIELGEIDTHLSRYPAIRENVTLVRRNKDEDKVLVSYIVLNDVASAASSSSDEEDEKPTITRDMAKGLRRHRELIKAIRDYLKTKLPLYSVPTLIVPLTRMPLNPNGKVDKPALPFPDTAVLPKKTAVNGDGPALTATQKKLMDMWVALLNPPDGEIPLNESFFDLGGHSILATRLVFEIRKSLLSDAPLSLVFDHPTLAGLSEHVDHLLDSSSLVEQSDQKRQKITPADDTEYQKDEQELRKSLPATFPVFEAKQPSRILLTGATGFVGSFILADLLTNDAVASVTCLVRAKDAQNAYDRVRESSIARGTWIESTKLMCIPSDLDKPHLGLDDATWKHLAASVDIVVHNGAWVHWVYPYSKMRQSNVLATLDLVNLAAEGVPKHLTFVSSTAVIEKRKYLIKSELILHEGGNGISENDSLDDSATGLRGGYGQSKWVAERLIMESGKRGLSAAIVRPAYIVGSSQSGVCNTDDFLWRLVKGCVQIGAYPNILNAVNMLPVDHIARLVTTASFSRVATDSQFGSAAVFHARPHPSPQFNSFLATLPAFGFDVKPEEYLAWRSRLEHHVLSTADNALFPLLHFVLDDLPTSTKAAELDDSHTRALLQHANLSPDATVSRETNGLFLAFLVAVGFLDKPASSSLPAISLPDGVTTVGRTGV